VKKILFIINVDWYFNLHWLERVKAAQVAGYEVNVATHFKDASNMAMLESYGFVCHEVKFNRSSMNPVKELMTLWSVYSVVRRVNADIVHSITVKPNLYAGFACTLLKINQVMSVVGLGGVFTKGGVKTKLLQLLTITLYRLSASKNSTRIIFENPDDRALFLAKKVAEDQQLILILGAGVDTDQFAFSIGTDIHPVRVLFAARLLWGKGLEYLVDAISEINTTETKVILDVAGIVDEDNVDAIPEQKIIEWSEQAKINWLGNVADMTSLITHSSIVALPTSYGEGVPRILIEAAAIGRPIITTDVVGCREIVEDAYNGYLVPVGSVVELKRALVKLIDSYEKRLEFGRRGREIAVEKFDQRLVIKKTLSVYAEL